MLREKSPWNIHANSWHFTKSYLLQNHKVSGFGETTEYDKKQAVEAKKPKSWCKSISAFANGRGGKLIFGIADDNMIIGLENAEKDAEIISEQIKVHLNPIPEFTL